MSPASGDRQVSVYLWATGFCYAILVYLTVRHHEPWADEAQAWLIARDTTLVQIWTKMASLEGTPTLWHSLLHALIRLGMPYSGLNIVSGILGLIATLVFLKFAPFPRLLRICIPFTYFLCFQYAVVARNYSLAPALLFSIAAAYRARAHVLVPGALLVLLASVSSHAFLLSAGLAVTFAVRYAREWGGTTPAIRKQIYWAAASYVTSIALIAWAIWPRADATFAVAPNWSFANFCGIFRYAFHQAFGDGYWPATLIALSIPALWRGPGLLFFAYAALSLCALGSVIYSNVWHHGFLVLAWLVALWLSIDTSKVRWGAYAALSFFVLLQCHWTWNAIRYDWTNPYSGSRSMAAYLKQQHLEMASIFAIGFPTVAVEPYFPSNLFANYATDGTRRSFWLWSKRNDTNDAIETLGSRHPDYVLIGYSSDADARLWSHLVTNSGYRQIANSAGATFWQTHGFQAESYEIFQAGDAVRNTVLSSDLDLTGRDENDQLLWGFTAEPTSNGYWTDANSGLMLQRPAIVNGKAEFLLDLTVPADQFRDLGPLTLTIFVCGHRLRPFGLDHPGRHRYAATVSAADLFWAMVPVSLQFEKSKFSLDILRSAKVALVNRIALTPK
jgi:hypothetical protein